MRCSPLTLLFAGLFGALTAPSDASAQFSAKEAWRETDEGPQNSTLLDAIRMSNGDVICVGGREGLTGFEIYVLRVDVDGNILWGTSVENPYSSANAYVRRVEKNIFGDIVILAQLTGGATTYDFFFVAMDGSGNVLAERVIDYFDWDGVVDMDTGPSGNVLFCGYDTAPNQYVVMKLDTNFNTIWTKSLGNVGQDYQYPTDLEITPNGDVLVTGQVYDGVNQDVRLDRLSPTGVLLYSKDFGDPVHPDYDGIVCAGSNGGTYFAFRKAAFEPSAEARIYRISQTGTVEWGMVDGNLAWIDIIEIENDEFIIAGVGPFDGIQQTFRRFTASGAELGSRTLELPGYEHNWIREVRIGPDDIIYTLAHATANGGTGPDWYVNALTIEGGLVYQWAYDGGVDSYDYVSGIAPIGDGAIIICGETGGVSEDDAHIVRLEAELTQAPDVATLITGQLVGGNVQSLATIDEDLYRVCTSQATLASPPGIQVILEGTVPESYPSGELSFTFTARAQAPYFPVWVELWNWSTGTWDRTTQANLNPTDTTTTVVGSALNHIDSLTGSVRARFRARTMIRSSLDSTCIGVNQAAWLIEP